MAKKSSVWGIEIGQSAIKALRCRVDGDTVVAEAFDYIEYPKILSQPEAEPEVLVREALQTFVSRNDLKKCRVALSVPGQSGLAKFFKPPPVELKKIPDIVKYEAKQQIPFDLKDVIWDYQLMSGGDISDGFALESEVGLPLFNRHSRGMTLTRAGQRLCLMRIASCFYWTKHKLQQGAMSTVRCWLSVLWKPQQRSACRACWQHIDVCTRVFRSHWKRDLPPA